VRCHWRRHKQRNTYQIGSGNRSNLSQGQCALSLEATGTKVYTADGKWEHIQPFSRPQWIGSRNYCIHGSEWCIVSPVLPFDIVMIGGEEAMSILPVLLAKETFQEGIIRIPKKSAITSSASWQRDMFPYHLIMRTSQSYQQTSTNALATLQPDHCLIQLTSHQVSFNCTSDQSSASIVVSSRTASNTSSSDFPCDTLGQVSYATYCNSS
jgi:hypothetical protein